MHLLTVLALIVAMVTNVQPRPPSAISYFPNKAHPWSIDDDSEINAVGPNKESLGYFHDHPLPKSKLGITYVYPKSPEGFVPSDLSALSNVYWWNKRFGNSVAEDVPYYQDEKDIDFVMDNGIKKRDYTAAQLVNMLKALAKTRRHRQIRISGKGVRFGISK